MADLLKAVKTTKKVQNNIETFESMTLNESRPRSKSTSRRPVIIEVDSRSDPVPLITAVSTRSTVGNNPASVIAQVAPVNPSHKRHDSIAFVQKSYLHKRDESLTDDAREILKSQPGLEDVEAVLAYIQYGIDGQHDFNIKVSSPKASLLTHTLVSTTLPDLWPNLGLSKISRLDLQMKNTLLNSLFSVAGIQAILEHIQKFSARSSSGNAIAKVYFDFLANLLNPSDTVLKLLRDGKQLYQKEVDRRNFWKDIVTLLAGSKVLSIASTVPIDSSSPTSWLTHRHLYSCWLGRNLVKASTETAVTDIVAWNNLSQLLGRAFSLGNEDVLTSEIYKSLLLGQHALWSPLHCLIKNLPARGQKKFFECMLNNLSRTYFNTTHHIAALNTDMTTAKAISGAAALINGLVSHNEYLLECAVDWITTPSGTSRGSGLRRALIAVLAQSQGNLERILERSLTMFSENSQIQNSSTAQQEHLAQTILLIVGNLHRRHPESLKRDPIPTLVMRSVSNRLSSSVPRTRLLGMIVGVGMSKCVDEPGKVMDFKIEEMETAEVKDMLALVEVNDTIGTLDDLKVITEKNTTEKPIKKRKIAPPKSPRSPKLTSKIIAIEEISSSSDDEEDLVPYHKPLDDPEDSEEDATLIDRNKPKAPIYIVDLIKQLQLPNDKLEVISLALKTAASLIRRKVEFGTELTDNIHSLASALINLQDGMSKSEHQQQRLDALVACLVSRPVVMGKYLASTYFNGDFSLSQRSTILIAIGLGARELAGFTDATKPNTNDLDLFPSERLPRQIHPNPLTASLPAPKQPPNNPIATLTNSATHATIRPLALAAAESQAGPKILQINRVSSSLSTNRSKTQQPVTRNIPKEINSILSNSIYLPLSSPLTTILAYISTHPSAAGSAALILHPSIVTLHLQTLTLILHTLGPTGLSTPSIFNGITHETLLLTSHLSRVSLSFDPVVLPALLGLLLALIDITVEIGVTAQERLLGDEFGGVVSELVRWVSSLEANGAPPPVRERDGDGRGGDGVAWTVLAAGIQVRWVEIGRGFQGRMLGLAGDEF